MFAGIVETLGRVVRARRCSGGLYVSVEAGSEFIGRLAPGDSVMVAGVCLTVTALEGASFAADVSAETLARTTLGAWDEAGGRADRESEVRPKEAGPTAENRSPLEGESAGRSLAGGEKHQRRRGWAPEDNEVASHLGPESGRGETVNLERALQLGDAVGGHLVSGHVDAVGRVNERSGDGGSERFRIAAPASLAPLIAHKGSICVDGVSLTVNAVRDAAKGVEFGVNLIPYTLEHTTFSLRRPGDAVNLEADLIARYVERRLAQRG